jgi:hypothetical protein
VTTLNGIQVHSWSMHWPRYGSARVDVVLTEGDPPTGSVTLACSGLSVKLGVVPGRSGLDAADRPHAVLVAGVGWQKQITNPLSYQSDSGIKLLMVLRKLAGLAGEPIEYPSDAEIGKHYECVASRPGEPVRIVDALNDLVRHGYCSNWRVDIDGILRFGERTGSEVTNRATQILVNRGVGFVTYGIDDPAQLIPGNTLDGQVIDRLDLREKDGHLEADVFFSGTSTPNIRDMVRRMVAHELGDRCRTYIVAACHSDGRCDLTPPQDARHLPEMKNVEQWITGGVTFFAQSGDEAIVQFRDERKTRPVITAFKRKNGEATAFPGLARIGDNVQSGGIGQLISFASLVGAPLCLVGTSMPAVPVPGPYLVSFGAEPPTLLPIPSASPLFGAIASGSSLVGAKRQ